MKRAKTKKTSSLASNPNASRYGGFYWLVQLKYGRQWLYADSVAVEDGNLVLRSDDEENSVNAIFAAGTWLSCHPATVVSGAMMTVEHFEVDDDE